MPVTINGTTGVQTPNTFVDAATGAMQIPVGTTAQRPASPAAGMMRLNSTTGAPEWYDTASGTWVPFSEPAPYAIEYFIAGGGSGGARGAAAGGYTIHTFTTSGTYTA